MPGETTNDISEQQVSTVEEHSPKQSKPDLSNNELPDDVPTESTSNPPINEITNGLKRSLPDGVDNDRDSDIKKKIRLVDTSEDELEVTSKDDSGKDNSEKDHIEMLIQRVDQITESLETTIGIESNISDETHNLNCEKNPSLKVVNHNGNSGLDDKPCMEDSPDKNTLCTEYVSKDIENKPTDTSNINNNCTFIENSLETEKNGKNKLVEKDIITSNGISNLNRSSSSDNLVIIENNDHEKVNCVVNDSPITTITENISTTVNDSTVTEHNLNNSHSKISDIKNIVYSKTNGVVLVPVIENSIQSVIKGTKETNAEVDVHTNSNNQDFEVVDSDSSSDISISDTTDLPNDISNIIQGVRQMSQDSFPNLLQLFSNKKLTYEQFDSLCTQKIIEMMTERLYWGKERAELQLLKEREKHWRSKYTSLNRQFKEIKTIVNLHKLDLKTNEHAKPHIITRTVGLQAVLCPKKEGSVKLPKLAIPKSKPEDNPVSIISDDEDDVIALNAVESAKPSTSKIENSTPKKQIPSSINKSKSPVVSPSKTVPIVPAAKSLDLTNDTPTIDLTGSDDVTDASNVFNLKEPISPFKVLHRQSPGILPAQVGSSSRTAVSNKDTISPQPTNLKPYILDVSRVDPVLVQPCTVTYTTQRVPISHISGTLQPIPTVPYTPRQITVSQLSASLKPLTSTSYTACQLPASSRMSGSLPQTSSGTTFTACRLPISIHPIPSINVGPQLSRPPPPAIPILEHPAPLPPIPNQRSLPSWKKLPPPPKVSLSKTIESRIPQALVLSWNMTMNRCMADIVSYQIYAYQEVPNQPPKPELWKKIGDVNALPLPMACSLTQFSIGEKYHFAVRAVDVYSRIGPFSSPQSTHE